MVQGRLVRAHGVVLVMAETEPGRVTRDGWSGSGYDEIFSNE